MGKDLLEASKSGNIALIHKLLLGIKNKRSGGLASLRRGPGVNIQDASGYSSLHHASLHGHTDVVRLLLQYDATPNLPDSRGSSALHLAAWAGHQDICKLLLTHSHRPANPNLQTVDNCTPLHCAAQHGHTGALTTLLAHGADPSVQNIRSETPLDLAAQYGRLQVVQMLIRAHPELLLPLKFEKTMSHSPLHLASRNGHKNVVEVLLMAGVHVNLLTPRGTALHEAALTGKESVVRLLLSAGVDLDLTDCEGRTVLDLLEQFPPHVTRGIVNVIHNCRNSMLAYGSATESDDMKENHGPPPRGHRQNHHYGNRKYRRSISPYTYDTSGEREDSSPMHHPWNSYHEETTSPSSSMGSIYGVVAGGPPSPMSSRPRSATTDASLYLPMKPKPPKKPPRRNLSVSPTYLMDGSMEGYNTFGGRSPSSHSDRAKPEKRHAYENLHLSKSGEIPIPAPRGTGMAAKHHLPPHGGHKLNRSHTVDQYVEMKAAVTPPPRQHLQAQNYMKTLPASTGTAIPIVDNENNMVRAINPNRKLRRNRDLDYENHSLEHRKGTFVTISPRVVPTEPTYTTTAGGFYDDDDDGAQQRKKFSMTPLSPTHYQQPPTPEHPPPPPHLAEKCIHERIRPLSQEYKRRSLAMSAGREFEVAQPISTSAPSASFMTPSMTLGASNGSLSSTVSLSDRSASTDCVEEFIGDAPFAGLFKGSTMALDNLNGYGPQPVLQKQPAAVVTLRPASMPPPIMQAAPTPPVPTQRPKSLTRTLRSFFSSSSTSSDSPTQPVAGGLSIFKSQLTNHSTKNNHVKSDPNDAKLPSTANTTIANTNTTTSEDVEDAEPTGAPLSPFDEQEEWAKISEIMATFGSSLSRDESLLADEADFEFRQRLTRSASTDGTASLSMCATKPDGVPRTPLGTFLQTNGLDHIEKVLIDDGYDDVDFLHGIIDEQDLPVIGIPEADRAKLMEAIIQQLPKANKLDTSSLNNGNHQSNGGALPESAITVEQWLKQIKLEEYIEMFKKNLYTDMERIYRVWEIELQAVLEINKLGHRKRILYSVSGQRLLAPNLDEINADVDNLKTNLQQLKDDFPQDPKPATKPNPPMPVGRHRKSRPAPKPPTAAHNSLEIRGPNELLLGMPCGLRAQWKHSANALISGSVRYEVNYLGSTIVKELRGTESTRKSIQKLKRGEKLAAMAKTQPATVPEEEASPTNIMDGDNNGPSSLASNPGDTQPNGRAGHTRRPVCLAINHRGVQFLDIETDKMICEHEIRNIDCACQDADDLSHFAYITKDQQTQENYCHVFNVFKMDLATEIILTLGQAFEVAYQLALREISPTTISKLF